MKRTISRRRVDHPSRFGEVPRKALSSSSARSSDCAESTDRREAASKGVRLEACCDWERHVFSRFVVTRNVVRSLSRTYHCFRVCTTRSVSSRWSEVLRMRLWFVRKGNPPRGCCRRGCLQMPAAPTQFHRRFVSAMQAGFASLPDLIPREDVEKRSATTEIGLMQSTNSDDGPASQGQSLANHLTLLLIGPTTLRTTTAHVLNQVTVVIRSCEPPVFPRVSTIGGR